MNRQGYLTWLKIACMLTIGFGVLAVMASFQEGAAIWLFLFDLLTWPIDGQPETFTQTGYTLNAVLGGVMVGWGILMYLLTVGPIAEGNHQIARLILISTICWFVVDSAGSVLAGTIGNVVLNASFLLIFIPPLLGIQRVEKLVSK